jgi:hypothetical protein
MMPRRGACTFYLLLNVVTSSKKQPTVYTVCHRRYTVLNLYDFSLLKKIRFGCAIYATVAFIVRATDEI